MLQRDSHNKVPVLQAGMEVYLVAHLFVWAHSDRFNTLGMGAETMMA